MPFPLKDTQDDSPVTFRKFQNLNNEIELQLHSSSLDLEGDEMDEFSVLQQLPTSIEVKLTLKLIRHPYIVDEISEEEDELIADEIMISDFTREVQGKSVLMHHWLTVRDAVMWGSYLDKGCG